MNPPNILTPASFDDFPYPSHAYTQTHPDHLASLAALSGLEPAPVERCRVLELGCASGGNIIPMAYTLPDSQFIGVDFSGKAVERGQESARRLGLDNIELLHADLGDIDNSFGEFDFIIAYGVFSWIPRNMQDKLLDVCKNNLAQQGVAYINYNAYPGWHMYRTVREAMFFRVRHIEDAAERVSEARRFISFLIDQEASQSGYGESFLQLIKTIFDSSTDGYLRHDFLAEENDPLYFHQFIERAEEKGLQYLANGSPRGQSDIPAETLEAVLEIAQDHIEVEQYLDILRNRTFRETLLCRDSLLVQRELDPHSLMKLSLSSRLKPEEEGVDPTSIETAIFVAPGEKRLSTAHPQTKAALYYLESQYPSTIPYPSLVDESKRILKDLGAEQSLLSEEATKTMTYNFLRLFGEDSDLVEFHSFQPRIVTKITEKPIASAAARLQIEQGVPVTNLYHQRVTMDKGIMRLLPHLDGSNDHHDLQNVLRGLFDEGIIEFTDDEGPVKDEQFVQEALAELLEISLKNISLAGLLVEE